MKVIIIAGGLGTRISEETEDNTQALASCLLTFKASSNQFIKYWIGFLAKFLKSIVDFL